MTDERSTSKEENERQYAVVDQMLTMHSLLRDRMERRAFWLNTLLIGSSLFLAVFAFIADDMLLKVGLDPATSRLVLGLMAIVVLLCTITEFRVDWRSVAARHADAVTKLAELKAKYRKSYTETGGDDDKKNTRLTTEYDKVMASLPAIPDKWFTSLKSEHQFKRILSERISLCPKCPKWYLWLQLRWEGISEAREKARERSDDRDTTSNSTS